MTRKAVQIMSQWSLSKGQSFLSLPKLSCLKHLKLSLAFSTPVSP